MHTYTRPPRTAPLPSKEGRRFRSALDVGAYAEVDILLGAATVPDVWHLDHTGENRCGMRGTTPESLQVWAGDPYRLRRSRAEGVRSREGCARHWVIVDSRPFSMRGKPIPPDEADVAAFSSIRADLLTIGVDLLDALVFDDQGHWWSMHELTTGTTAWTFVDDAELATRPDPPIERRDEWDRPWRFVAGSDDDTLEDALGDEADDDRAGSWQDEIDVCALLERQARQRSVTTTGRAPAAPGGNRT